MKIRTQITKKARIMKFETFSVLIFTRDPKVQETQVIDYLTFIIQCSIKIRLIGHYDARPFAGTFDLSAIWFQKLLLSYTQK